MILMPKPLQIALIFLVSCSIFSQPARNTSTPGPVIESLPLLTFDGSYFPEFLLDEKFYNYQVKYRISDKLMIDIQSFYTRFGTKERLRLPIFVKARISENLYLLAGPEMEYDLSGEVPGRKPRISVNSGIEYQREDSFYINALFNYQLNDSNVGPQGNIGGTNMISVSSGIKF